LAPESRIKVKKDLVLFVLQAIAIYAADENVRKSYQEDSVALETINKLSNSPCELVATTAKRTLQVLHWKP